MDEIIIYEARFLIKKGGVTLLKKGDEFKVVSFLNEGILIDTPEYEDVFISFDVFKLATREKTVCQIWNTKAN